MPELPEVETVRRGLEKRIVGKKFAQVRVINSPKSFEGSAAEVDNFLIGAHVTAVVRWAKTLRIDLDTDYSLVIHLKMTGQLVHVGGDRFAAGHPNDSLIGKLPDKSTRVSFAFEDGSNLYFNDQRKFGWVKLMPSAEVKNLKFMKTVGPEPLDPQTTPAEVYVRVNPKSVRAVKAVILDQTVVAGIGNIYADESLWMAKIHPATPMFAVSEKQFADIFYAAREVMQLSIEKGGSTDRNYVDADGKKGSYLQFANVFRREGQACPRCGTEIIKIRVAGRGTHVCPACQVI